MSRIIVAPHCDDEIIGCFIEIKKGIDRVIFVEWNEERKSEAEKVAEVCKFEPIFDYWFEKYVKEEDILFVPCMLDAHLDHKAVNERAKKLKVRKLIAYTVDKNIPCIELNGRLREEKRWVLGLYRSQQKYDEINELYIRYEGYLEIVRSVVE